MTSAEVAAEPREHKRHDDAEARMALHVLLTRPRSRAQIDVPTFPPT